MQMKDDTNGAHGERLIDLREVLLKIPVARSTIFAWMRDGTFPVGRKVGRRRRLWREVEIDDFVRDR
jgi:predicted DNA-binding transcriptional regulator AlpA